MKRIVNINPKLQSLCAGNVEIKESAKRVITKFNLIFKIFLIKLNKNNDFKRSDPLCT